MQNGRDTVRPIEPAIRDRTVGSLGQVNAVPEQVVRGIPAGACPGRSTPHLVVVVVGPLAAGAAADSQAVFQSC